MRSPTWREGREGKGGGLVATHRAETATAGRLVALLVAEDPLWMTRFRRKLQLDGYAVVTATGLDHALEAAAIVDPDLIFIGLGDWAIPAQLLRTLRADPATAGVPTVLISDRPAEDLSREVGGLRPGEHVLRSGPGQIHGGPLPALSPRCRPPLRRRGCRRGG